MKNNPTQSTISVNLKRYRVDNQVGQYYMSMVIGCSIRTYKRWENENTSPIPIYHAIIDKLLSKSDM